jgi:hypothetical protein
VAQGREENRVLYFEIVAGVHLFQQATNTAKEHYSKLVDNIKTLQADLNADVKAKLEQLGQAYATQEDAILAKIKQVYDDWDSVTAETVAKNIAQIEKWKTAQIKALEEAAAAARAQASAGPAVLGPTGNAMQSSEIEKINALLAQQKAELEEDYQARLKLANLGTQADAAQTAALEKLNVQLDELRAKYAQLYAEQAAGLKSGGEQALAKTAAGFGVLWNGLMTGIPILGAVALGIGGVYTVLDHVTMAAANYSMGVLQAGAVTGLFDNQVNNSYKTLQGYTSLFEYFGMSQEQVNMVFVRFNETLSTHSKEMQQLGLDTTNMNNFMESLSAKVSQASNDSEKQAIVLAALGRSMGSTSAVAASLAADAEQLTAALNLGPTAIKAYMDNLQHLGLILTDTQLQAGAAADAIHGQMTLALQGLERQVGTNLYPVMEGIWLIITSGAENSGSAISNLAKVVAEALGTVFGFFYGLFGGTMDSLQKALDGASTQIKTQASDMANAQNAQIDTTNQLTAQTKALQDANKALQEQERDRDQQAQLAQQNLEKSIRDQTQAIDDQINMIKEQDAAQKQAWDDQLNDLENQKKMLEDQQKLQDDLNQSLLSQLQTQLDMAQDVDERRMRSNESLVDYARRMHELDLKDQIATEQNKRQTQMDTLQQQIDLLKQQTDAQKENLDKQEQQQVDALNAEKQNLQNYLEDRRNAMQNELAVERAATDDQIQRNEEQLQSLQQATDSSFGNISGNAHVTAQSIEAAMQSAFDTIKQSATGASIQVGQTWHQNIMSFLSGDQDMGTTAYNLGVSLGEAIAKGMGDSVMNFFFGDTSGNSWWQNIIQYGSGGIIEFDHSGDKKQQAQFNNAYNQALRGSGLWGSGSNPLVLNAAGGIYDRPTLTMSAENYQPEAIIPLNNPGRAMELMKKSGLANLAGYAGGGAVVNFNGPVADALVGARVADRIVQGQRKNQMRYGAGL